MQYSIRKLIEQEIVSHLKVGINQPDWIDLHPSDRSLSIWLQDLPQNFWEDRGEKNSVFRIRFVYRCAIAFQLAKQQKSSPEVIAKQLLDYLTIFLSDAREQDQLDLKVRINKPGWIDFHLSDRTLAIWLQDLPQKFLEDKKERQNTNSLIIQPSKFIIQYAHARCCSLLRLGHRDNLIQLHDPDFSQPDWQWLKPNPIPWLYPDLELGKFQLLHPTEQHLIMQLLRVVDALNSFESINWIQIATQLAQAMLEFNRNCRIWGDVKKDTPELAQARLGLIAVTQLLLQWLLEKQIQIAAPIEL